MTEIYKKISKITSKQPGITLDHHGSSLYVKPTREIIALTNNYPGRSFFISKIDNKEWIELPGAYPVIPTQYNRGSG